MGYTEYNPNSKLFKNQSIMGRDPNLYPKKELENLTSAGYKNIPDQDVEIDEDSIVAKVVATLQEEGLLADVDIDELVKKLEDKGLTNGKDGKDGENGKNATIETQDIDNGKQITLKWYDDQGSEQSEVVTLTNGNDGATGPAGPAGEKGADGQNGKDVTVDISDNEENGEHTVTFNLGDEQTKSIVVKDGKDGQNGQDGQPGKDGKDVTVEISTEGEEYGQHTVTFKWGENNSQSITIKDGEKGEPGQQGPAGQNGEAGPKGDNGEPGATGPAGPAGPAGEKGADGIKTIKFKSSDNDENDVTTTPSEDVEDGTTVEVTLKAIHISDFDTEVGRVIKEYLGTDKKTEVDEALKALIREVINESVASTDEVKAAVQAAYSGE